jgi:hypothetical protein
MTWEFGGVASKLADEATDNHWDANVGLPDDKLPEVPPDGEWHHHSMLHTLPPIC